MQNTPDFRNRSMNRNNKKARYRLKKIYRITSIMFFNYIAFSIIILRQSNIPPLYVDKMSPAPAYSPCDDLIYGIPTFHKSVSTALHCMFY